jgi:hypothetical protein
MPDEHRATEQAETDRPRESRRGRAGPEKGMKGAFFIWKKNEICLFHNAG